MSVCDDYSVGISNTSERIRMGEFCQSDVQFNRDSSRKSVAETRARISALRDSNFEPDRITAPRTNLTSPCH